MLPSLLFKYFRSDDVDVLFSQRLRFSRASRFNDPFDLLPRFDQFAEGVVKKGASQKLGIWSALVGDEVPTDELSEYLWKHISPSVSGYQAKFQQQFSERFGVSCFSESIENLLMWSHYANSHQGFALAFDTNHEFFRNQTVPVVYSTARPHIHQSNGLEILRTKGVDWLYEREWRVIVDFSGAPQHEKFIRPLPVEAIKAIFLGARATPVTIKRVFDALQLPKYRQIEFCRMEPHPSEFRVVAKSAPVQEPNSDFWKAEGI